MYKQTLCFIRKKEKLLVLNREYKPLKGLWNGVGGKIEPGETPKECIIREVKEETGIDISSCNIIDKGIITWNTEGNYSDGLYVFVVAIEDTYDYQTPRKTEEGILDWKEISWLTSEKNFGVGQMMPYYLNNLLKEDGAFNHHCILHNNVLTKYELLPIHHRSKSCDKEITL